MRIIIKTHKHRIVHRPPKYIISHLSVKFRIIKEHSFLFTLWESRGYPYLRLLCTQEHAKARSRLLRLRPWTPWIWGILNSRSIRVTQFKKNVTFHCFKYKLNLTRTGTCQLPVSLHRQKVEGVNMRRRAQGTRRSGT
jgi:hypothetical protein